MLIVASTPRTLAGSLPLHPALVVTRGSLIPLVLLDQPLLQLPAHSMVGLMISTARHIRTRLTRTSAALSLLLTRITEVLLLPCLSMVRRSFSPDLLTCNNLTPTLVSIYGHFTIINFDL